MVQVASVTHIDFDRTKTELYRFSSYERAEEFIREDAEDVMSNIDSDDVSLHEGKWFADYEVSDSEWVYAEYTIF